MRTLLVSLLVAFFGSVLSVPAVAAVPQHAPTADCTAQLTPSTSRWTAQCSAPHLVTIKLEIWYTRMPDPTVRYLERTPARQLAAGEVWNDSLVHTPDIRIVRLCMTAFQDTTLVIAPRVCAQR